MGELTDTTRLMAAILLIGLVTVETGGLYLLSVVRGRSPATSFQLAFARAGHAHAGVLLILSLVGLLYAEAAGLEGIVGWVARAGLPVAALLMPAGFFLSSKERRSPPPTGSSFWSTPAPCRWQQDSSPSHWDRCSLADRVTRARPDRSRSTTPGLSRQESVHVPPARTKHDSPILRRGQ